MLLLSNWRNTSLEDGEIEWQWLTAVLLTEHFPKLVAAPKK
jgi:hypothetical protein